MLKYNIFGSKDSQDYDILVFVDSLGTVDENHATVKLNNVILETAMDVAGWPKKPINSNLGILEYSKLIKVFKGTADEVNNSCYYTYHKHKQVHPLMIDGPINRDEFYKQLKLKRCFRFIISFYSRVPEWRKDIREAMKGTFDKRLAMVKKINFTEAIEFPGKKEKREDIYKVLAFQIAQTLSLCEFDYEIYSKEEVIVSFEPLKNFILRQPLTLNDLEYLERLKQELVSFAELEIKEMFNLNEEIL